MKNKKNLKKLFFFDLPQIFFENIPDLEGKFFPDPRKSIGILDMKILKKQAKKRKIF